MNTILVFDSVLIWIQKFYAKILVMCIVVTVPEKSCYVGWKFYGVTMK